MVKRLYDSGVQIVAGTDLGRGYALHSELEITTRPAFPPPKFCAWQPLKLHRSCT